MISTVKDLDPLHYLRTIEAVFSDIVIKWVYTIALKIDLKHQG